MNRHPVQTVNAPLTLESTGSPGVASVRRSPPNRLRHILITLAAIGIGLLLIASGMAATGA
ncbi:MAG: hypothetical protein GY722_28485 [bacterium]|nr:hypothetical protein [bacterium]